MEQRVVIVQRIQNKDVVEMSIVNDIYKKN